MEIKSYRDLTVWQSAKDLTVLAYEITKSFPKEEIFGITNQIRRASFSISNYIAEGSGRQYKKDTPQFLFVSNGSLNEVESIVYVAIDLKLITENETDKLIEKIENVRKLLKGFIKYYQNNSNLK